MKRLIKKIKEKFRRKKGDLNDFFEEFFKEDDFE